MPVTALVSGAMSWFRSVRRLVERHPFASDAGLALVLAALVQADIWSSSG
jgi:hypothetical protein